MKSLRGILRETTESDKINAYGKRHRKENGDDLLLPGHIIDFVEQDAVEETVFNHNLLTQQGYHLVRDTQVRRKFDVTRKVVNKELPIKTKIRDET